MTCTCRTPRPMLVWCAGVEFTVCGHCGERTTEPTARTAEPTDENA